MTKRHFIAAAEQVKAILDGNWTFDLPGWAEASQGHFEQQDGVREDCYTRATQTAEAYIDLFSRFNLRFNVYTFLMACGLKDAPTKTRKRKTI